MRQAIRQKRMSIRVLLLAVLVMAMSLAAAADPASGTGTDSTGTGTTGTGTSGTGTTGTGSAGTGTTGTGTGTDSGDIDDPVPAAPVYKIAKQDGVWYLINYTTGKAVTGRKGIKEFPKGSGNYYWFKKDKDGSIYRKAWIRSKNKVYRATNSGVLAAGRAKVGSKYYFFNKKTFVMSENVWKKLNGGYQRYGKKGVQQFGFAKIGNYTYYLDPENDGARATGWTVISDKTYYFDTKGRMKTGFLTLESKTYYLSSKGFMVKGWLTIGTKKYYFNSRTGVMVTGKKKIDGKTYDFGTQGYIETEPTGAWSVKVNKTTNVVTIYRGSTPVKAMLCSVGLNDATPSGNFSLQAPKPNWHPLFGNVYGQYCRTITGNILFHSVYYYTARNIHTLATGEYNKLGSAASHGCVRLAAGDAYYIWTKVPTGTTVSIGYFGNTDPLPRPARVALNGKDYDPTDPILGD